MVHRLESDWLERRRRPETRAKQLLPADCGVDGRRRHGRGDSNRPVDGRACTHGVRPQSGALPDMLLHTQVVTAAAIVHLQWRRFWMRVAGQRCGCVCLSLGIGG